jgi:2,3-bisphosphoglycerate-independent phosphoglycerate mutase
MPKCMLIIMDGWGMGREDASNPTLQANTPFVDSLYKNHLTASLFTHGPHVGLPEGQMGNSEVGHLHLGAGRVVWQMLERINRAIDKGELRNNKTLVSQFEYCITNNKPLHLLGLVSDGGVHASIEHLKGIVDVAVAYGIQQVYIHAFTDGRDTDPKSGLHFLQDVLNFIEPYPTVKLASICGRYYAMDRDQRWERVKIAYDALVNGVGELTENPIQALLSRYEAGETDEFLTPLICGTTPGSPKATLQEGDAVLFFNFRTDRGRQLVRALTQEAFLTYQMHPLSLNMSTLTAYDKTFKNIDVVFENADLTHTLGEQIAAYGLTQLRAAETEKYPHVTFFFSGGREKEFEGETRILVDSPKVATYDLQPQMSAIPLTQAVISAIQEKAFDFVCVNYANPDMVGHTGVYNAIIKAVETVDSCVESLVTAAMKLGYNILITADHGNAELAVNPDGTPHTAHTLNKVPFWLISHSPVNPKLKNGSLVDIAPTILSLMEIPKPNEMSGNALY